MMLSVFTPSGVENGMTIDPKAVRAAREALSLSQEQLAKKAGVSQTTIDKIERGETKRSRFIFSIAGALQVLPFALDPDLDLGPGGRVNFSAALTSVRDDKLPVFGAAEGGPGNLIVNTTPLEMIERPQILSHCGNAYAIYIVGESMLPEFEPGDRVFVDPSMPIINGVSCVFYTGDPSGEMATIKRLERKTDAAWTVQQWNPQREFELDRDEWPRVHRTVGKWNRR